MSRNGTTLYVTGFGSSTRARDLAYEFERYGRLVRCDIPAPRTAASRLRFAFVEYESRRDADDAYHEMHNQRLDRDEILKIEWARTPPSASWRFDTGRDRDRERAPPGRRSPRRSGRSLSPLPRRGRGEFSPRKDDRRDRDLDRDRDSTRRYKTAERSRSPQDRPRSVKEDRDRDEIIPSPAKTEERKVKEDSPPERTNHDELDVAE